MSLPCDAVVLVTPSPGKADELEALLTNEYIPNTKQAKGCLMYRVHKAYNQDGTLKGFILRERWNSGEEIRAHAESASFLKRIRELLEQGLLAGPTVAWFIGEELEGNFGGPEGVW